MLSDTRVKAAKPKEKPYKLTDHSGLFLRVYPNGSKLWQMRYAWGGKEKSLSFGKYPLITLVAARQARDDAKRELLAGRDPGLTKRQRRAAARDCEAHFEPVARKWLLIRQKMLSARYGRNIEAALERHVFPSLGSIPMPEITPPMILEVVERIRAKETAKRILTYIKSIFVSAIAQGLVTHNPAVQLHILLPPVSKSHFPAITDLGQIKLLLRQVESLPAHPVIRLAHRFLALTATRSQEVRLMRWDEIDGDCWIIPADRMKRRREHIVPLVPAMLAVLEVVKRFTGNYELVFPSERFLYKPDGSDWQRRPISDATLGALIKRAGYTGQHVPHGWRAAFSTIMNERKTAENERNIIEVILAHSVKGNTESAYNRALWLPQRRQFLTEWSDLLLAGAASCHSLAEGSRR